MKAFALGLTAWVMAAAGPALAIDPGTASGHYKGDGVDLTFTHAIALSMENVEGMLDSPRVVRVLLSHEEVPPAALEGLVFTPAHAMARAGQLHGLLIEFDPADRNGAYVRVLAKPDDPRQSFTTITLSNTEGVWTRLEVNPTRTAGELRPNETFDLAASFSAPVFTNAVQADLKGAAAQGSPQVKALLARYDALIRGDMAAALALSTGNSAEQLKTMPPEVMKQAKAMLPELVKELKTAKRVVVRRDTAAVQTPDGSWFSLVLQDGTWKSAD